LTRGAPSSTSDRRAADELQQAKQALTDARRQQQALLAQLQMQQLEAALQTLASDQQEVIQRLAQERLAVDDVVEIAGLQARVRKTTGEAADRLKSVPVFARSLRAAADDMRKAEIELTAGNAGDTAMRPATEALRQLELLADAIGQQQQASPPPGPSPSQSPPAGGAAPQNQAQNAAQARMLQLAIAQLTVLRKMQAGLESQTAKLEQSFAAGELSKTDLSARTAGLAAEQRDLAELAASVMRDADLPPIDEEYESP
jgi:DNA repair exonuclease SbcCD ATPase subunit